MYKSVLDLHNSTIDVGTDAWTKMKNKTLEVRITEYEDRQLKQEAERRGMSKSELVRSLIARFPAPV